MSTFTWLNKQGVQSDRGFSFRFTAQRELPPYRQWNGVCRDCGRHSPDAREAALQRPL